MEFMFLYSQTKFIFISKSQESKKSNNLFQTNKTNTEIVKIKHICFIIFIEDQSTTLFNW